MTFNDYDHVQNDCDHDLDDYDLDNLAPDDLFHTGGNSAGE